MPACYRVVGTQIFRKICQAIIHKLLAIYIFQLTYLHRLVSLKYFSYDLDLICINRFSNRFTNQVGVVAPEVMKDNWNKCFLWLYLEFEIIGIVSRFPKLTCNMAVVPNLIIIFIEFIFTNPTAISFGKFFLILFCYNSV